MMKLILATNNDNKLKEFLHIIDQSGVKGLFTEILSLQKFNLGEIPETHETIEENALEKANFVFKRTGIPCIADDTGLEINALDGRPGVYSARYAGENVSYNDNVEKVLKELKGIKNRKARFITVIAFVNGKEVRTFQGIIDGVISLERKGINGFGYDPVFIPNDYQQSFAEMSADLKNNISHRAKAFQKLIGYLESISG